MDIVLAVVSSLLIISVFLSLVKSDFWIFKVLEYPRLQKLVLIVIAIACWAFFWQTDVLFYKIIIGLLVLSVLYLLYNIWPYTKLSRKDMKQVAPGDRANELKVFAANVLQDNTQYQQLLAQIKASDPDIIFLLETNRAWADAMQELAKDYPHTILAPLENTYGLLFYSRYEIAEGKLRFLVKDDVPSIEVQLMLPSGRKIQLYGLHPEPPVPGENLYSTAKDKELMKVALKIKDCKLPCIVFGDLNDVAWSHTTQLFRKTSELLDPRRGRGFYSTFSAHSWFIRFPLDYIFCSKEFQLVAMKRLPKNGSDHFATLTHIALRDDLAHRQHPQHADQEEKQEAREMATQEVKE